MTMKNDSTIVIQIPEDKFAKFADENQLTIAHEGDFNFTFRLVSPIFTVDYAATGGNHDGSRTQCTVEKRLLLYEFRTIVEALRATLKKIDKENREKSSGNVKALDSKKRKKRRRSRKKSRS